ncbi:MAG: undecaprenyl-diphosphate phosphatase [Corallococcus sp.]|nr:undecaprenyl-diphosphate phosphatase [Bacillota bacterium]MCM1533220.1 undecaprenyl-diphosphate phosphatase [Corallococcus sp.]
MTVLESIFLGLLQGFTEFLPVSSSGHLLLAEKLFDIHAGLFFDVMLHIGTLLAVIISMRKSLLSAIRHPVRDKRFLYLVIASIPTFVLALLVKLFVPESFMQKILPVGFALTIVLIVLSDRLARPRLRLNETGWLPAVITGITQGVAVFPGLSRSGSTISVMKLFGVNASDAAEFSFLLSVPIIVASALVEGYEAFTTTVTVSWYCIAIGILAAFVSGLVSVYMVMRAVKTKSWIWFAVYLIIPLTVSLIIL